jgi:5,10-methylenetetrahydromethanopterin reductase
VQLGPAAVNPFTCHPINIAGNMALIDEMSGGRAYLGLARGGWLDFLGLQPQRPVIALREAFDCVRLLLNQSTEPYQGQIFSLAGGEALRWQIQRPEIPFLLGSWGAKTIQACQHLIREVKIGGTANPDVIPQIQRSAVSDQESTIKLVVGAVTVVDEDGQAACALARREAALYLPIIATLDHTLQIEPDRLARINEAANRYDFEAAGRFISDDLLRRLAFAGTPEQVAHQAAALFEAGVQRVEFGTPHGLTTTEGLRLLGEQVLPALREWVE